MVGKDRDRANLRLEAVRHYSAQERDGLVAACTRERGNHKRRDSAGAPIESALAASVEDKSCLN